MPQISPRSGGTASAKRQASTPASASNRKLRYGAPKTASYPVRWTAPPCRPRLRWCSSRPAVSRRWISAKSCHSCRSSPIDVASGSSTWMIGQPASASAASSSCSASARASARVPRAVSSVVAWRAIVYGPTSTCFTGSSVRPAVRVQSATVIGPDHAIRPSKRGMATGAPSGSVDDLSVETPPSPATSRARRSASRNPPSARTASPAASCSMMKSGSSASTTASWADRSTSPDASRRSASRSTSGSPGRGSRG